MSAWEEEEQVGCEEGKNGERGCGGVAVGWR